MGIRKVKYKKLGSFLVFTLLLFLSLSIYFSNFSFAGSGRTIQGRILQNDSNPARNATVIVHTRLVSSDCNCSTSISSVSFTDANGDYTEASNNLRFDTNCAAQGTNQGDDCDGLWTNTDWLWITVNGSTVVPVAQGDSNTIANSTYTWAYYYLGAPTFADVLNSTLAPSTVPPQPNITLNKTDATDPVLNGTILNYTIIYNNIGYENATNVTIIENYPFGVSFVNATPSPTSGNNTWFFSNIGLRTNHTINISVLVFNVSNGTILNNRVNLTYLNTTNNTLVVNFETNTTAVINFAPIITYQSPIQNYYNDSSTSVNVTFGCNFTDDLGLSNISLYITNSSNQSFALNQTTIVSGTSNQTNWLLNLSTGNYTWNCLAYDIYGSYNFGENRTLILNYSLPNYPPYWSNNQSSIVTTYSPITLSYFNITWQDLNYAVSTVIFESNYSGTLQNYTMAILGGNVYSYSTILPAGYYIWKSSANDTFNLWNSTVEWIINVSKATTYVNLSLNGNENNLTLNYSQLLNATFSTNYLTATLYRNGTNVSSENNSAVILGAGTYNYTVINPGNSNYSESSKTFFVTVNQNNSTTCSLTFNPLSPQNYGVNINASCSCTNPESSATLYRDGINVTASENNLLTLLSAQNHTYVCNVSATQNYSGYTNSSNYTITSSVPILNLTALPSWNVTYGNSINVSCTVNTSQVTPLLYLNGTLVSNPHISIIGAGNYNFSCNNSVTQNYSSTSISNSLNINPAASSLNLTLNGVSNNLTIALGSTVNVTASTINPSSGYILLYRNGVLINSGTSPLSNISIYNVGGLYNFTLIYNSTQNYSYSSLTYFLNVNDNESPVIISTNVTPYDPFVGDNVTLNMSVTDNGAIYGKYVNITLPNGTLITYPLDTLYLVPLPGRYNLTFFANDTYGNLVTVTDFFIAGTTPLYNIYFNAVDYNFFGIPVNMTIYLSGTSKQIDKTYFVGTKIDNLTNILYDLYYVALDDNISVRLNAINISLFPNNTLGLDRLTTVSGYLITYGLYSDYNFSNATLIMSYAYTNYTNENNLTIYTCADWNFTARNCTGNWTLINGTLNTTLDTMTFVVNHFSAFSLKQETNCGDNICNGAETCSSCSADCGTCTVTTGGGGGGGGGGVKTVINKTTSLCQENWKCSEWSSCINESKFRTCTEINNCGTSKLKPYEETSCLQCTPNWNCSDWSPSECITLQEQTRKCKDLNNCNLLETKPTESRNCQQPQQICLTPNPGELVKEYFWGLINVPLLKSYNIIKGLYDLKDLYYGLAFGAKLLLWLLLLSLLYVAYVFGTLTCGGYCELRSTYLPPAIAYNYGKNNISSRKKNYVVIDTNLNLDCHNRIRVQTEMYDPFKPEVDIVVHNHRLEDAIEISEIKDLHKDNHTWYEHLLARLYYYHWKYYEHKRKDSLLRKSSVLIPKLNDPTVHHNRIKPEVKKTHYNLRKSSIQHSLRQKYLKTFSGIEDLKLKLIKEDLELLKDRNLMLRNQRVNGKEIDNLIKRREKQLFNQSKVAKKEGFKYKINKHYKH